MLENYVVTVYRPEDRQVLVDLLGNDVRYQHNGSRRVIDIRVTATRAEEIRQDPRVMSVALDPNEDPLVGVDPCPIQTANFERSLVYNNASWVNWGLARSSVRSDPYTDFFSPYTLNTEYRWNLDTSGIDIIIVDSGIQVDHPEFAVNDNGSGGSRVVDYDWAALAQRAGIPGVPSGASIGGYFGDSNGHGTHVAGTAAGNRQGWARQARIYTLRIFSGPDTVTNAPLGSINPNLSVRLVRAFHLEKPVDPVTGFRRPTVVNNSWAYFSPLRTVSPVQLISQVVCRGVTYEPGFIDRGTVNRTLFPQVGVVNVNVPLRVDSVDADIEDATNDGVIYTAAANNFYYKIDLPGGPDWDNYIINDSGQRLYYHRGSTPGASRLYTPGAGPGAICVGNLDNSVENVITLARREVKNASSSCGPRIDIWAPGTGILSAYKRNTIYGINNSRSSARDVRSPPDRDYWLFKISGTSMACPQVTGVLALALTLNPGWDQAQCLAWLQENSTRNALSEDAEGSLRDLRYEGLPNYSNFGLLQDAPNYLLYNPYGQAWLAQLSGAARISGAGRMG